ncbi:MAG: dihydroorotate dehydrogenase electron transfer subunit [Chitinivibrionales bacterium]|nr:dihydroorotate dehydrogenase electron transfer subunit [Chitinivibrionales bacterium]MBD3356827.1 dihydroorotate dehydrogenase electron transfer subunit [Chitinivibrionales bacterium]
MKHLTTSIKNNNPIAPDFYELAFSWDPGNGIPTPGRFLTIRVSESAVPLLRRPFAFSGYDPTTQTATVIYQRRGPATDMLAAKTARDTLDIVGPLGNGFPVPSAGTPCLLVGGGVGLGPVLFLARDLESKGFPVTFVAGFRTRAMVPSPATFNGTHVAVCTDDGTAGFAGTTVDYLETLSTETTKGAVVFCCGPTPMLKGCHEYAQRRGLRCRVSMEQVMACGVGACMGCVVKVKQKPGYARVCKEGPVFESGDLLWE